VRAAATASLIAAMLSVAATASADPPGAKVHFDPELDVTVTLLAGTSWVVTELDKPNFAPGACRWCDGSLNGLDRSVRSAFLWKNTETAASLSNIGAFGLAPLSALGVSALAAWHDHRAQNIPADSLIILQASLLAMDLNQAVKFTAGRARPYARFANATVLASQPDVHDASLSFFSGHATWAFSLATASGTLATMRGYRWAPWVWAQGLAVGVFTGYLRIAADRHYFTDVLTGALIGSAVGVAVPLLHRPGQTIAVGPVGGLGIGVVGIW
jgi:membrane-associated phospholipid phosphatase